MQNSKGCKCLMLDGHKTAMLELVVNILVGCLPIWLSAFNYRLSVENSDWGAAFYEAITNGELIIYSVSIMGTIFYATLRNPPLPGRNFFSIFCLIIACLGAFFYARKLDGGIRNVSFADVASYIAFGISAVMLYIVSFLGATEVASAASLLTQQSKEFKQRYANRKAGDRA